MDACDVAGMNFKGLVGIAGPDFAHEILDTVLIDDPDIRVEKSLGTFYPNVDDRVVPHGQISGTVETPVFLASPYSEPIGFTSMMMPKSAVAGRMAKATVKTIRTARKPTFFTCQFPPWNRCSLSQALLLEKS